jgi:glycosyltransferase involved in cell wall biosynthesis
MGLAHMSLFSVVIPTYNRAALLQKALQSVLAQDCQDFEIIVIDDGSTDATLQVLQSFGDKLRLFRQGNQGPGAARNLGAKYSRGEYIAFLDSDDLWFPWTLATYAKIIEEKARPTLIAGTLRYFHDEGELSALSLQPVVLDNFPDYYAAGRRGLYCGTCQMVVRRDAILGIGGFAEGNINAEDHDLVMRLGTAPGFVSVTSPAMIAYRQHVDAVTKDLSKTFTGLGHLLEMERSGSYPGGRGRRRDRRRILAHHVRPLTLDLLRQRQYRKAWALYRQTFLWNFTLGRFRYLAGFFLRAAMS